MRMLKEGDEMAQVQIPGGINEQEKTGGCLRRLAE